MATPIEQLQSMRSLKENWDGYNAAAPPHEVIELAQAFVAAIEALLGKLKADLSVMHVSPSRTGGVLIEWEDRANQHEVEISPDRSFAFLHLNKATGHIETRKLSPGVLAVVHPGFLQELSQLLAA